MALLQWVNNRDDVDGLLCPDDDHGKRFFLEIKSKNTFQLQVDTSTADETISVGPFVFLKSAFRKANSFPFKISFHEDIKLLSH